MHRILFSLCFAVIQYCVLCVLHRNLCTTYIIRPMHMQILHFILIWLAGWLAVGLCARNFHVYAVLEFKESRKKCIIFFLFDPTTPLFAHTLCILYCLYFTYILCRIDWVSLQFSIVRFFLFAAIFLYARIPDGQNDSQRRKQILCILRQPKEVHQNRQKNSNLQIVIIAVDEWYAMHVMPPPLLPPLPAHNGNWTS